MSKILMVASEAAPFAKTGGLADVVGALPGALRGFGHETKVLIPRYRVTRKFPARRIYDNMPVSLGGSVFETSIFQSEADADFLFVDFPPLFDRDGLYGDSHGDFGDNDVRFGLLSRVALEVGRRLFRPDIFHCHDWQAGLVPVYLRTQNSGDPTFYGTKTLFTIHNLGYQGLFRRESLGRLGLPDSLFHVDALEFYGNLNLLKGGLVFSDWLSTVSKRYAQEIQTPEYGFALEGLLRARSQNLSGIVNGVDYDHWNPQTDKLIPANYSSDDLTGKQVCKQALMKEFGLADAALRRPLIGIVSRFTSQKGADLISQAAARLFENDIYLVALGAGEPQYEAMFRAMAAAHPGRVSVSFGYNEALAHRIEAGSDIFLMPSAYEPCGLNQIYSLKYGTVPVVRATGGLDDTITPDTGFKFQEYTPEAMLEAVHDCINMYASPKQWRTMVRHGMCKDFSWKESARQYSDLYASILNL